MQHGKDGTLFTISNNYTSLVKPDTTKWFTKYYRENNQSNINGLGLGLYLVQQVAQAHAGTLKYSITPTSHANQWLISIHLWLPSHNVKDDKK